MSSTIENNSLDLNNFLENYQDLKKNNISENKLYNNERTMIIGLRATQLSKNAKAFINVPAGITDVKHIAELELKERKLPYIIKRRFDTHDEYWKLEDLV